MSGRGENNGPAHFVSLQSVMLFLPKEKLILVATLCIQDFDNVFFLLLHILKIEIRPTFSIRCYDIRPIPSLTRA